MVAAGAAGMNMEDGTHDGDARGLAPLDYQLEKIAAFMDERKLLGSEFLLNARVDSFIAMRDDAKAALAEGLRRGQAYADAGADSVFYFGVSAKDDIRTLVQEVPAPVSVLAAQGVPSARELEDLGVARVSYGSMFLRVAVAAVKRTALEVLEQKTHETMSDAIGGAEMKAILEGRVA
jgi:2-methylisocitrate lyase-like PEP mutase family enzyme